MANLIELSDKQIQALSDLTQQEFNTISKKLEIIDANTAITATNTKIIKSDVKKLIDLPETVRRLGEQLSQLQIMAETGRHHVPGLSLAPLGAGHPQRHMK